MFSEDAELAKYIREHSDPNARIAVLGSEPEIYFYSRRRSATGYIYTYPLMEQHKYALKMQEEMIHEIEVAHPEYMVFVKIEESWLMRNESERKILNWYEEYSKNNYDLVKMIKAPGEQGADQQASGRTPGHLLLFKRRG